MLEIDSKAFLECTNLEKILIEKSLINENLKIENFEINTDYQDEQYVEYKNVQEYSESYQQYMELSEEEKNELNIVPTKYDVGINALYTTGMEENYNVSEISEEEIPESYDLRDKININVENQAATAACYSYASLTAVETNLALIDKDYIDFSEVHQAGLTYGGYGNFITSDDSYYADKLGPVYESEWPIENILQSEKDETTKIIYEYLVKDNADITEQELKNMQNILKQTKAKKYVTETVNMPSITKGENKYSNEEIQEIRNIIKTHIMKYGALSASIDGAHSILEKNGIQVSNSNGFYVINHAVSIIGWDDNFSKDNFPLSCKPENDGSYLALNSWGEDWGENGCFWISYEDHWVEEQLSGVISVEDVQENINISSIDLKDIDTNKEISQGEMIKGRNVQTQININVNQLQNNQNSFDISIIAPNGEDIAQEISISGNNIENKKAQILLNFNTKILEIGSYKISLKYGEETISRTLQINPNTFDYIINDNGTITITKYFGNEKNIIIPEKFLGYDVTGIANSAFINNDLETITILGNIIFAGNNIIDRETIVYGNNDTYIQQYANQNGYNFIDLNTKDINGDGWYFKVEENKLYITQNNPTMTYKNLSTIIYKAELLAPVDQVLDNQFRDFKNLDEVILPNTITKIGESAFYGCSKLENINIPDEIISIGAYAFGHCEKLTQMDIPSNIKSIEKYTFNNCINLIDIKIPNTLKSIGEYAFGYCSKLPVVQIPQTVTNIGEGAFQYCESLTNIEIPEGITTINRYTFRDCTKLINVKIPETVTNIGQYAFYHCDSLKEIKIPKGVTTIGGYAFRRCQSLTTIEIPDGVTKIENSTFAECLSLKTIKLPERLTSIGSHAFWCCRSLENIEIPKGITKIDNWTFYDCENLKRIEIPEGVTTIGEHTFRSCESAKEIIIPEGVTTIGTYAFQGCKSATKLQIPKSLTTIESHTFQTLESLTDLEIPEDITSIGEFAFAGTHINKFIENGTTTKQEMQIPNIIKRVMNPNDVLYSDRVNIYNMNLNTENNQLIVDTNKTNIRIYINSGLLKGLYLDIKIPSGTITYSKKELTMEDVIATLHINNGETITNNNGLKTYTFTENGEFEFKYTDINGQSQTSIAKVDNIEKNPITVTGNPTQYTNENVTLKINVVQELIPLGEKPYSFDGGETWQVENTKTYTENTFDIIIKVKDKSGKIYTLEPIDITKIGIPALEIVSEKYNISDKYISKIKINTTIKELKANISTNATQINIYLNDKLQDDLKTLATGMKVELKIGEETKTFKIAVQGDASGDGIIDIDDIFDINRHRLNKGKLVDEYLLAGDYDENGVADIIDIFKINKIRRKNL